MARPKGKGAPALADLVAKLSNAQAVVDLISDSIGEEALGLVKDGFRTEADPYGTPWPKKVFTDGRKTLSGPTSRLKNGWKFTRKLSELRITPSVDYAHYHQSGTGVHGPRGEPIRPTKAKALKFSDGQGGTVFRKSVQGAPKRMMVPDAARGLPDAWVAAFEETALDAFEALLGDDKKARSRIAALVRASGLPIGFLTGE